MGTLIDVIVECLKEGPKTCDEICARYSEVYPRDKPYNVQHKVKCRLYKMGTQKYVRHYGINGTIYWELIP